MGDPSRDPAAGAFSTRRAVERYIGALNRHDRDEIAACVTPGFHNEHTSAAGVSVRGRDAYRERLASFLAGFEDLRYEVEDLLVDGDRAAVPYRMTFRYGGTPVSIRGMFRFRVSDGLIDHRVDYWDGAEFERQTGKR
ncbi:nuclear transport factor 2 family protein [Spongiactinospora sp. TRM90649]|uniref:ester cyclase n=1 Tax=Spongiactinospora sp. TRM90649 TaxID=3031114 RepID=UPI0023F6F75C|nr:nuclear transport factor 2 family protein [Spongiactinospora sp. TRM90649]MDF5757532.1 nuclear transport factor 2 family protein [Spongiactinospora sp. TRM90649]